jgi:hypothetical protein
MQSPPRPRPGGFRCHNRRQAIGIIGSPRCISPDVASCSALLRADEVIE